MSHEVEWTHPAHRDLVRLDHQTRERVRRAVQRLADEDYGDIKRLQGIENEWRLRVGQVRVRYTWNDLPAGRTLSILRVLPRDRAYRDTDD